ncbi:MAG: aspartate--tRNA ligase [Candidatus Omnitrophica bacterium]|nr:aspartate--tRNA ligase [Candidatus Omnitrophota bacterium]
MLRTHTCGELTEKNIGQTVTLCGWVDTVRDHGGLVFMDLRDRYGKTQLVRSGAVTDYKSEDCVQVTGTVRARPKGTENLKLVTGKIEVASDAVKVLSAGAPLPFEVQKSRQTNEDLRLQYRYLDLRNPDVQKNLFTRHRVCQTIRRVLDKRDFIEVETPILTKSTPEGARDYLVPSRVNQGEFFALPQSPQLFKQILMVSGFDRYFQIAKCFRDEDLRADRQPEFTQLDMEMSFLEEDDLFGVVEETLKEILKDTPGLSLKTPFPRLTYQEAMNRFGSDKPDLRFGMEIKEVGTMVGKSEFKIFEDVIAAGGGVVAGICLSGGGDISRKDIDGLIEFSKAEGASGLAYFKVTSASALDSPIAKFFPAVSQAELVNLFGAKPGDLLLLIADQKPKTLKVLGALRLHAAKWKNIIPGGVFNFSWVTDFPLFKYNEEEKRWDSEHHPFTAPNEADWKKFKPSGEFGKIRSRAYDLVLNGSEIASGSVRIHDEALQKEIFETIGLNAKEAAARFGFLLKAFEFGAPPHGGIALGIDRILAILLGLDSIREVIAFPKNQKAVCPMTGAPSPVSDRQLKELGIKIR